MATLTGSDLTFAEGLVRSGYLRPTAIPSGPTGVNPVATTYTDGDGVFGGGQIGLA